MNENTVLNNQVIDYLKSLGYSTEMFRFEFQTPSNRRVDILVTRGNQNLIVVEVKHGIEFIDIKEISFHPTVRRLQMEARELNALSYLLTNGVNHYWLKTGTNGRPELTSPKTYDLIDKVDVSRGQYFDNLFDFANNFLQSRPITGDIYFDMSYVIYLKVISDLGGNIPDQIEEALVKFDVRNSTLVRDAIQEILNGWSEVDFIESKNQVLVQTDKFLLKNRDEWQVPRWLSDFMVKLYPNVLAKERALDIFSRHGTIISSAYNDGWRDIVAFYMNRTDEYWVRVQSLITGQSELDLKFKPDLLTHNIEFDLESKFDCSFVAPPFGYQIDNIDSVQLLIEKSLKYLKKDGYCIAIVPDGFLLSNRLKGFRDYLISSIQLKAVINLPPETFKPYSSVSTSLIALRKTSQPIESTFFASAEDPKNPDQAKNNLQAILSNWIGYNQNRAIEENKNGFIVNDLESDNLHFSNYWFKDKFDDLENLGSKFQTIPLKELVEHWARGAPIKNDENGNLQFISPAAVRAMELRSSGIGTTSVPQFALNRTVNEGDVIVNIIGTHKGEAALVTEGFSGLPFNQHLVVLRANTRLILPEYLAIAINSGYVQRQMEASSSGSVIPSLTLRSLEGLYLPVPPISVQDSIVRRFHEKLESIRRSEQELNSLKAELREDFKSLGRREEQS